MSVTARSVPAACGVDGVGVVGGVGGVGCVGVGVVGGVLLLDEELTVIEPVVIFDYNVTDDMMAAVEPYLAQGDVLMALRLLNDKDSGSIAPIELKMPMSLVFCVTIMCIVA